MGTVLSVQGVGDLIDRLEGHAGPLDAAELEDALEQAGLTAESVAPHVSFNEALYQRTVVHATAHFEVVVISWRAGQRSTVHDHVGSSGAWRVLQGMATELHFGRSSAGHLYPTVTERHVAGEVASCDGSDVHQVCNLEADDLVTLHVYSPPLSGNHTYGLEQTPFGGYDRLAQAVAARAAGLK